MQADALSAHCTVLVVCTGNICRSPAAERVLTTRFDETISVRSAGTHALSGQPISEPMRPLILGEGADVDDFVAQQLSERLISDSDLVLGMTREHRSAVVQMVPSAVRRTFTLLEYARLLQAVDPQALPGGPDALRLKAAVPLAAAQRRAVPQGGDDVIDPYQRGGDVYSRSFAQMMPAIETIGRLLTRSAP